MGRPVRLSAVPKASVSGCWLPGAPLNLHQSSFTACQREHFWGQRGQGSPDPRSVAACIHSPGRQSVGVPLVLREADRRRHTVAAPRHASRVWLARDAPPTRRACLVAGGEVSAEQERTRVEPAGQLGEGTVAGGESGGVRGEVAAGAALRRAPAVLLHPRRQDMTPLRVGDRRGVCRLRTSSMM